jgi:ketosteroid isomerase-like protein
MRKILFTVLVLTLSTAFLYAQKEEQSIRQMMNEIRTAVKGKDLAKLETIYAPDFMFISAAGVKYTRSERINYLKTHPAPEILDFDDIRVRTYGNSAVVNFNVKHKDKGTPTDNSYATAVFINSGGHWQEANVQSTRRK